MTAKDKPGQVKNKVMMFASAFVIFPLSKPEQALFAAMGYPCVTAVSSIMRLFPLKPNNLNKMRSAAFLIINGHLT